MDEESGKLDIEDFGVELMRVRTKLVSLGRLLVYGQKKSPEILDDEEMLNGVGNIILGVVDELQALEKQRPVTTEIMVDTAEANRKFDHIASITQGNKFDESLMELLRQRSKLFPIGFLLAYGHNNAMIFPEEGLTGIGNIIIEVADGLKDLGKICGVEK